jgi:hypothetical protein
VLDDSHIYTPLHDLNSVHYCARIQPTHTAAVEKGSSVSCQYKMICPTSILDMYSMIVVLACNVYTCN